MRFEIPVRRFVMCTALNFVRRRGMRGRDLRVDGDVEPVCLLSIRGIYPGCLMICVLVILSVLRLFIGRGMSGRLHYSNDFRFAIGVDGLLHYTPQVCDARIDLLKSTA